MSERELLARIDELNEDQMRWALDFLSGYSPDGVEAALKMIDRGEQVSIDGLDFKEIDGVWHLVVPEDEYRANIGADPEAYEREATEYVVSQGWAGNIPCLLPNGSLGNEVRWMPEGIKAVLGILTEQAA